MLNVLNVLAVLNGDARGQGNNFTAAILCKSICLLIVPCVRFSVVFMVMVWFGAGNDLALA